MSVRLLSFYFGTIHILRKHILLYSLQGRNRRENLDATSVMVGRICPPPGGDRVKVPKNLVAPVAPVDTSLPYNPYIMRKVWYHQI